MSSSYDPAQSPRHFPAYIDCAQCGCRIRVPPSRVGKKKFCSNACRNRSYEVPVIDGEKPCSICGVLKPLAAFSPSKKSANGRSSHCHECRRPVNASYTREYVRLHPERHKTHQMAGRARKAGVTVRDFTAEQWEAMKAAYGHRCAYCGESPETLTIDHVVSLNRGGQHTASNIVPACASCNCRKGDGPPPPMVIDLAREHHPDAGGDAEAFHQVMAAYEQATKGR